MLPGVVVFGWPVGRTGASPPSVLEDVSISQYKSRYSSKIGERRKGPSSYRVRWLISVEHDGET
jgi:hypothetical protein